jgi:isoleucyl-tRNA synthetase
VPVAWKNLALIEKWKRVRELRRVVTGALELERAAKTIGSSLEAAPTLYLVEKSDADILNSIPFEEIAITSGIKIVAGDPPPRAFALPDVKGGAAIADLSPGGKCQRCWRVLTEVGTHEDHPDLCNRCDAAVAESGPVEKSPA